jgi:hypothetical protein
MTLLGGVVGFRPWGKPHRGLSALLPCCCSGGKRAARVAASRERVAEASFPTRRHEELLGGVLDRGPLQVRCLAMS